MTESRKGSKPSLKNEKSQQNGYDGVAKKPLSEKWQGYALALAGGVLGSSIGIIVSPIVLFTTTIIQQNEKYKPNKNRFKTWALAGVVGAPLCIFASNALMGTESNLANAAKDTVSDPIQAAIVEHELKTRWACEDSLKASLKDPRSYKPNEVMHINPQQYRALGTAAGDELYNRSGDFDITIDYTARNGFGGATRGYYQCTFTKSGQLINTYNYN